MKLSPIARRGRNLLGRHRAEFDAHRDSELWQLWFRAQNEGRPFPEVVEEHQNKIRDTVGEHPTPGQLFTYGRERGGR